MTSLRRTLLLSLLGAIVVVSALIGVATYWTVRTEVDALMDAQLRQLAMSLRDQQPGLSTGAPDEALDFVIQIWDRQGVRLYLSQPHQVLPALAQFGYNTVSTSEGRWRVFSIPMRDHVIQIAQPMAVRTRIAAGVALRTVMPVLGLMPLLGVLIWYLVGRGLRPLVRLTGEVAARRPDALDRLRLTDVPEEVQPLVAALNGLLQRLEHALNVQRAFVADAAHELRTPLAALKIQLQLVERAAGAGQERAALDSLRAGLERASHLVAQLLVLARQEPGAEAAPMLAPVTLAEVLRRCLVEQAALAQDGAVDLGAGRIDDGMVMGDADALQVLISNLVDNAVRYTQAGGRVDVALQRVEGSGAACSRLRLTVDDSGPGIAPAERERVLDRFYRSAGSGQPGSGLGLAIVRSIALRHHAGLKLDDSPLGGLRVMVDFDCL